MERSRGPSIRQRCPICGKRVGSDGPRPAGGVFPFCSARCRDIDLGRWLDGKYQIPVTLADDGAGTDAAIDDGPRSTESPTLRD